MQTEIPEFIEEKKKVHIPNVWGNCCNDNSANMVIYVIYRLKTVEFYIKK